MRKALAEKDVDAIIKELCNSDETKMTDLFACLSDLDATMLQAILPYCSHKYSWFWARIVGECLARGSKAQRIECAKVAMNNGATQISWDATLEIVRYEEHLSTKMTHCIHVCAIRKKLPWLNHDVIELVAEHVWSMRAL